MVGSVRVLLEPIPGATGDALRAVSGAVVSLARLGSGSTLATTADQPAKLVFQLVSIGRVRDPEERSEQSLATISGTLSLKGPLLAPLFELALPGALSLDVASDSSDPASAARAKDPRRALRLDFDSASFSQEGPVRLPLPPDTDEVRFVELQVELEIGGAPEAPRTSNDILDKPIILPDIPVEPSLCLDTAVADPAEHNLAFRIKLPPGPADVASVLLDGAELKEGEDFFQHDRELLFRPPGKPNAVVAGLLVLSDDQAFDFELTVAKDVRDKLDSLMAQLENGALLADAAANRARTQGKTEAEALLVRDELRNQVVQREFRLLDSIEASLTEDRERRLFFALQPVGTAPEVA